MKGKKSIPICLIKLKLRTKIAKFKIKMLSNYVCKLNV